MKIVITKYVVHTEHGDMGAYTYSRDDDGMIIGKSMEGEATFGEDPREGITRFFLTGAHAIEFMKEKCREYLGRPDVDFVVKDGDNMVTPASRVPKKFRSM